MSTPQAHTRPDGLGRQGEWTADAHKGPQDSHKAYAARKESTSCVVPLIKLERTLQSVVSESRPAGAGGAGGQQGDNEGWEEAQRGWICLLLW